MGEGRVGPRTLKVGPKNARLSRLRRFAQNNLGVIMGGQLNAEMKFRDTKLDVLDQYYEGTQYEGLPDWDESLNSEQHVAVRQRKPRIIYNLPKTLVDKVASKITGTAVFPQFITEEDPDTTQFFRVVQKACNFRRSLMEPIKRMLASGSVFVRYYLINGVPKMEYALAKYCYPVFDAIGQLDTLEIKYTFEDWQDLDPKTSSPKVKWYRMVLSKTADILYDNPEFLPNVKPTFTVVQQNNHNLGWVQGEWLRTVEDKFDPDGWSLLEPILSFFDDMNYSLSQSSQAISYNQEPQLVVKGMDEEEMDTLVKSSSKAWFMGRDGEASYLETQLAGVEQAGESRDSNRQRMLDVCRVVMHDPEKLVGSAQSAKAMEVLHGPLIELIDELRTVLEPQIRDLLIKIALTILAMEAQGFDTAVEVPPGWQPETLDITVTWPAIFPPTVADIAAMATACNTLNMSQIISKETLTRWMCQVIPTVENVEEELEKIAAEPPPPSPFGGGF